MPKLSLITTVFNEEDNIISFLNSLKKQTIQPGEIIIVDAESTDKTAELINNFDLDIKLIIKECNRSEGRNIAIKEASNKFILVTDGGCLLDENWVKKMKETFKPEVDVVSGWYQPLIKNNWQGALAKVLNFKAKNVREESFLPSSRSLGLTKSIWEKGGKYPEDISTTSEDTIFDLNLKKVGAKFAFAPKAIVYWELDSNYSSLYKRIKQYAYTDGLNRLWLSQYKILGLFLLIEILLLIFKLWPVAVLILLAYLYLPFIQSKKVSNLKELYRVPVIKGIMIWANIFGFIKGLLKL